MRASNRAAWAQRIGRASGGAPPRAHKYGARGVVVDGIAFDSGKEGRRYRELALLAAAGEISAIEIHPAYPIVVVELFRVEAGSAPLESCLVICGTYTADFRYVTKAGEVVVEDVKSDPTRTTAYRLRKRLVEAIYGITIREV